jgi:UDP-N-acetylglucosamine 2-epimerase (non-hydrolysing)
MLVDIIAGARPNFMKIAPLVAAIRQANKQGKDIQYRLVHTGQHYDQKLSQTFFDQLNIPKPDLNLEVGSGTQAVQTANVMVKYEVVVTSLKPDLVLVVGDVNSTMACAIVAKKMGIKVAHVEAGIRSLDWSMPEEVNRVVTDAITDYFFTTTTGAGANLRKAGVSQDAIFLVGNTMIDTLLRNLPNVRQPDFWNTYHLQEQRYVVCTLHRPNNVDEAEGLHQLIWEIGKSADTLPVVFPVHPRTRKNLPTSDLPDNIILTEPLGYLEFIYLVKQALAVVTDSGGIQEETTVLRVPCITLRDNTERPETVEVGTNELIGTDPQRIKPTFDTLFAGNWKQGEIPDHWDGKAGERIVRHLVSIFEL